MWHFVCIPYAMFLDVFELLHVFNHEPNVFIWHIPIYHWNWHSTITNIFFECPHCSFNQIHLSIMCINLHMFSFLTTCNIRCDIKSKKTFIISHSNRLLVWQLHHPFGTIGQQGPIPLRICYETFNQDT
jgi:hypothetical protein